jgi:hypothetical protein
MRSLFTKSKKLARLEAARKKLPKSKRAFFVALLVVVSLHYQAQLHEQMTVRGAAAHEGVVVGP